MSRIGNGGPGSRLKSILFGDAVDGESFGAALAQVPALLAATAITYVATNLVFLSRRPDWIMPTACILSFMLLSSIYLLGRRRTRSAGHRHEVIAIHLLSGLSAAAIIAASILIAETFGTDDVPGIVLICLNATMAILIGFAFAALPSVGLQQLLIAGIPGMAKILYDQNPDAMAIGFMFIGIVTLMVRMIMRSNKERLALIDMREDLARKSEEAEKATLAARTADRAKSEFLANMSHEIRTPMNGVMGMAELLARTELDARQRTFTDVIVKSGASLLTIINDILDFSKIDAGQIELDPAPFSLSEAVEDVATLFSTKVLEKDIELIVRVDPQLPASVSGDVGRIRQIITNLLGNAVKFTEFGHVLIEISGSVDSGMASLRFAIEDTGIGIPADKIDSIFEKFTQVDASSTRRHEGTGLGLAITSRLVELMNGKIGVESDEGKGATFWFTIDLPVVEWGQKRKRAPIDVSGARILVIDDNQVNRSILLEQLASWNFDCAAAPDGRTGLAVLARAAECGTPVDCVILDFQMPDMNGADVLHAMRQDPATAATPVVLLTSVEQAGFVEMVAKYRVSAHLTKPARSSQLLDAVVNALSENIALMQTTIAAPEPVRVEPEIPYMASNLRKDDEGEPQSSIDVLVAEDNEVNQIVFTQILSGIGVNFKIVGNGRLALESSESLDPALILMDVSMPEMNGIEATQAIRAREQGTGRHVPIVGVTAHALKGDRERCLESGMDDYLTKPVSPAKLAEIVGKWMDRSRRAA
ncbi:MAG: response regulator [Rhizobiaceae bacterium]